MGQKRTKNTNKAPGKNLLKIKKLWMRHKLCCSIVLLVPYQHFLKTVYNLRKIKKNWVGLFLPQWGKTRPAWGKKIPAYNSWITRYLATLHLTYVRAIIYNPTFHKKKKKHKKILPYKKKIHFSLFFFFACFVSFSFFFFACVSFLVLLLIWLFCLFVSQSGRQSVS